MAAGRKTGGRRPGSPNKRTAEREQAMTRAAAKIQGALGTTAFTGDAHTLLMAVYKDETQPIELRVDAAKAAIKFERPALAASTIELRDPLAALSDEDVALMKQWALAHMTTPGNDPLH